MIVFRDPDFCVHNGFFSGIKVEDLRYGLTIIPSKKLRSLLSLTWPKVRKSKTAEHMLFRRFCEAAAEPISFHAALLERTEPDDLAREIFNEIDRRADAQVSAMFAAADERIAAERKAERQ